MRGQPLGRPLRNRTRILPTASLPRNARFARKCSIYTCSQRRDRTLIPGACGVAQRSGRRRAAGARRADTAPRPPPPRRTAPPRRAAPRRAAPRLTASRRTGTPPVAARLTAGLAHGRPGSRPARLTVGPARAQTYDVGRRAGALPLRTGPDRAAGGRSALGLGPRLPPAAAADGPGPGAYALPDGPAGPGWSVPRAAREGPADWAPGTAGGGGGFPGPAAQVRAGRPAGFFFGI